MLFSITGNASAAEPAAAITSSAEPAAASGVTFPTFTAPAWVQVVRGDPRGVRSDETGERHQAELH
jgi:hypothetical protein